MRLHIVFELDATPDAGLADIASTTSLAATAFRAAMSPLGECRLLRLKSPSHTSPDQPLARREIMTGLDTLSKMAKTAVQTEADRAHLLESYSQLATACRMYMEEEDKVAHIAEAIGASAQTDS
jgi:hypothetical protein